RRPIRSFGSCLRPLASLCKRFWPRLWNSTGGNGSFRKPMPIMPPCAKMPRPGKTSKRNGHCGTKLSPTALRTSRMADYKRGDVWLIDFDPTQGHEQAGRRPGLIVSVDLFNQGPAGLVVVVPLTSKDRRVRWHVPVDPPEAGLKKRSFIMCENI